MILPITHQTILKTARRLIREGEVVAFPTDTVYGLGADAFSRFGVTQLFTVKQRPKTKAIPVFIAQLSDLNLVAQQVPNEAWLFLEQFWPGALTVVLPKNPQLIPEVTGGTDTVAVRIPDYDICLQLVTAVGKPLAVTSANLSGQPTPKTAQAVAEQLGETVPLIIDDGPSPSDLPSTIVDFTQTPPKILRQGALSFEMLQAALPDLQ